MQDGETLRVWTQAGAGKSKRIRNDGTVRIAPCTSSGQLLGEWQDARAKTDKSPEAIKHVTKLMQKKYGVMFNIFVSSAGCAVEQNIPPSPFSNS